MSATVKRFKNGELVEEITYTKAQLKKLKTENKGNTDENVFKNEEDPSLHEEVEQS